MNWRQQVSLLILTTSTAAAGTIFSDLSGDDVHTTPGGYVIGLYSPGNSYDIGVAFRPIAGNSNLDAIRVVMSFSSGVNDIVLTLRNDSGNTPGSALESWDLVNILGPGPGLFTLVSILRPNLSVGEQYWITAAMEDSSSTGIWWINSIGAQGIATSRLNGGSYTPGSLTDVGFHAFEVTGSPEPATTAAVLLGCVLQLAFLRRRERRMERHSCGDF